MRVILFLGAFLVGGVAYAVVPHTESSITAAKLKAATKGVKVGVITLKDGKKLTLACAVKGDAVSCAGFGSDGGVSDRVKVTNVGLAEIVLDAGDGVSHTVKIVGKHNLKLGARAYIEEVWTDMRPLSNKPAAKKPAAK